MSTDLKLNPAVDRAAVQTVVIAAAVDRHPECLTSLPRIVPGFDEPYRSMAAVIVQQMRDGQFIDWNVVGAGLQGLPLMMPDDSGKPQQLTAEQVVSLVRGMQYVPEQVGTYLQLMDGYVREKRQQECGQQLSQIIASYAKSPGETLNRLDDFLAVVKRGEYGQVDLPTSELGELIPFMSQLESEQRGTEFLGLDTGFPNVNRICNGFDTGLTIVAAPPGEGKTTLMWQVACQVARINRVPVIFVSLEQSKKELRAKALARLSQIEYRHLLRGRLHANDPQEWTQVLTAADSYASFSSRLFIVEGDENTTVERIREVATRIVRQTAASRCLIVIDYLQKLPPSSTDARRITSAKDRIDLLTSALRRLARDLDSPVVCISSENRQGYGSTTLDVFKESGEIEYSADVAVILTGDKECSPAPDSNYRAVNFNVCKNRNGATGCVKFRFYAARAEFVETGTGDMPGETSR